MHKKEYKYSMMFDRGISQVGFCTEENQNQFD